MIPLSDTVHAWRYPTVTRMLVAANVVIFLLEASAGTALEGILQAVGLVPARFWTSAGVDRWGPVFVSMFLHGGLWHLVANMWALWLFGDNVEDALGHARFLAFYLVCGVAAALTHAALNAASTVPTIGASGAIAGVLGAYLVLYPSARVVTLLPLLWPFWIVEVPAILYLGLWFASQVFNGVAALGTADVFRGGVAWWAHVGGFVAGLVLGPLLRQPRRRRFADEYFPW
jgi:membrane associated rhomboid family serine protease